MFFDKLLFGCPQPGHAAAWSDILLPHSVQYFIAMINILLSFRDIIYEKMPPAQAYCFMQNKNRYKNGLIFGGRAGTRTLDPLIKSQLLYQLSYAPDGSIHTNTRKLYIFFCCLQEFIAFLFNAGGIFNRFVCFLFIKTIRFSERTIRFMSLCPFILHAGPVARHRHECRIFYTCGRESIPMQSLKRLC